MDRQHRQTILEPLYLRSQTHFQPFPSQHPRIIEKTTKTSGWVSADTRGLGAKKYPRLLCRGLFFVLACIHSDEESRQIWSVTLIPDFEGNLSEGITSSFKTALLGASNCSQNRLGRSLAPPFLRRHNRNLKIVFKKWVCRANNCVKYALAWIFLIKDFVKCRHTPIRLTEAWLTKLPTRI